MSQSYHCITVLHHHEYYMSCLQQVRLATSCMYSVVMCCRSLPWDSPALIRLLPCRGALQTPETCASWPMLIMVSWNVILPSGALIVQSTEYLVLTDRQTDTHTQLLWLTKFFSIWENYVYINVCCKQFWCSDTGKSGECLHVFIKKRLASVYWYSRGSNMLYCCIHILPYLYC